MTSDWLIRNAVMVSEGRRWSGDLRVRRGRIDAIGAELAPRAGERELDARGRWLLPGKIDDQVHFREPGLEHKATIATESRAAVAGGVTSYMDMPNNKPPALTREAVRWKYARAAECSPANFAFYIGASNDNLEELKRLRVGDACGIKVFMGASTGNMLVDDPGTLDGVFREAPLLVITHCEDSPTIEANLAAARARYGDAIPVEMHPEIRSREACMKSSLLATGLARRHDARLHILHVSTEDELALFEPGPIERKRITAETCVHFLRFDARDYGRLGNRLKCNPAVKLESDRLALTRALTEGRIDVLATDHAPHTIAEKALPYEQAPSGLPLVQDVLQAALECVREGSLSLETVVQRVCHAPALLFGVRERGYLREGYHADLVLVDPDKPDTRREEDVLSKCGWSPFEGTTFSSTVDATWVNGHLAWHEGKLDDSVLGQALECTRGRD
jgi:dihydroorotase